MTSPSFHGWLMTGQGLELRTSVETLFFLLQAHIFLSGTFWKLWLGAVRVTWGQQCGQAVQMVGVWGRGEGVLSRNHLHLPFCLLRGFTSVIIRSCTKESININGK